MHTSAACSCAHALRAVVALGSCVSMRPCAARRLPVRTECRLRPAGSRRALAAERQLRHRRPARPRQPHADAAAKRSAGATSATSPTSELQFHLYWNAWRDAELHLAARAPPGRHYDAPRDDAWGSIERHRAADCSSPTASMLDLTPQQRFIAPDDGNAADRTVMAVPAAVRASQPNETMEIEVEWTAKIPRPFARTGYIDDYYFIAQWFPKLGVLEDGGWNTHQFHAATEFYADYGVYDVRITVPRDFVVGASGPRDCSGSTTRTARRRTGIAARTSTTSRGRRARDFSTSRRTFEHPTLPRGRDAAAAAAGAPRPGRTPLRRPPPPRCKYYGEWFGAYPYGSHHDRRSRRSRAAAAAWSTRRSSPPARAGSRRASVDAARVGDDPRGRAPVVVRDGRQQRVRARVDGRGDSTPSPRRA